MAQSLLGVLLILLVVMIPIVLLAGVLYRDNGA